MEKSTAYHLTRKSLTNPELALLLAAKKATKISCEEACVIYYFKDRSRLYAARESHIIFHLSPGDA